MDILFYYSGSADKAPGLGANESVSDRKQYQILQSISHWRKILSNFYIGEFVYDGRRYRTAEHAFQGAKISLADPTRGYLFSLDSDSSLSHGDGDIARKNRKMIVLNSTQVQQWNQVQGQVMEDILTDKFIQIPIAARALLATLSSALWHGAPRVPKARQYMLERVREKIGKEPQILAYLFEQGDISLIDDKITRDNLISILARVNVSKVSPHVIEWMRVKNLHPEWFIPIISGSDIIQGTPPNLWKMLLANAIVAKNIPLITTLISHHRDEITAPMIDNMIKFANGDEEILSLIQ